MGAGEETVGPELRPDRRRRRSRRLRGRHPRGAAEDEGGAGRARASGRHLPQLGLHPDQGAAALGRGAGADAPCGELRPRRRQPPLRRRGRGQAQPRRGAAAEPRRRLPAQEEQGHRLRRRGEARRQGQARGQAHQGRRGDPGGQAHHPGHRGARPPAARPRDRRQAGLELQGGHGPGEDAEVAAGGGLRARSASSSRASTARWTPR